MPVAELAVLASPETDQCVSHFGQYIRPGGGKKWFTGPRLQEMRALICPTRLTQLFCNYQSPLLKAVAQVAHTLSLSDFMTRSSSFLPTLLVIDL